MLLWSCSGDVGQDRPESGLRFDSEIVLLRIDADTLEVEAWYQMLCTPTERPYAAILYPYPRDSLMGVSQTILVECRAAEEEWRPVAWYERSPVGVRWTLPLDLGDTLTVHTAYRQVLHGPSARYIVTTTRTWNRPLTSARFEIHLPDDYDPLSFSHEFAEQPTDRGRMFRYEKRNFWPDRDILVTWTQPPKSHGAQP